MPYTNLYSDGDIKPQQDKG